MSFVAEALPAFSADQHRDPASGLFKPGNNARRLKQLRIEAMMADIADNEFEGGLDGMKPSDVLMLRKACTLLCSSPKSHWDAVRGINSAGRILGGLRKRLRPVPRPARRGPSVAALLDRGNGHV